MSCKCKQIPELELVPMEHMYKAPEYAHDGDSGMDVYAAADVFIPEHSVAKIPTGVRFNIPKGYEIQVRSRSGLASQGITVANSPGTVDSPYTGEIFVLLAYSSQACVKGINIKRGHKIAQLVFAKVEPFTLKISQNLNVTDRGDKGFGSTDVTK